MLLAPSILEPVLARNSWFVPDFVLIRLQRFLIYSLDQFLLLFSSSQLDAIGESCARNGPPFRATLLIDYQRGSRLERGASSRTAIAPLLARSPACAEAYLWRTPALVGEDLLPRLRRALLAVAPQRARELLGLLHMKLLLFDDTLIVSGYSLWLTRVPLMHHITPVVVVDLVYVVRGAERTWPTATS